MSIGKPKSPKPPPPPPSFKDVEEVEGQELQMQRRKQGRRSTILSSRNENKKTLLG